MSGAVRGADAATSEAFAEAVAADPVAAVEAWCVRATAAPDPVRLHVAQALARRAAARQGPARARMAERIAHWLAESTGPAAPGVGAGPGDADAPGGGAVPGRGATGPGRSTAPAPAESLQALSALVDRLGRTVAPSHRPGSPRPEAPPLKAVAAHAGTWSRLRARQRLRQALDRVPAQAGPLHSARLVHRALQTLHDLAPAYLDAFIAQVENLHWLEQATGGDLPARAPARGPEPARRARKRSDGAG